jgi:undecaprenyl-diphosphatase
VLLGGSLLEFTVKGLVGRPRPLGWAPGFPSGHVTAVTAFAVTVIYVIGCEGLSWVRRASLMGGLGVLVAMVGLARLSLHAHWPSDLLGGLLLGTATAAAGAWWHADRTLRGRSGAIAGWNGGAS